MEVVGDVEDAVDPQFPAEVPEQREDLRQETQARPLLAGKARAGDRERPVRVGKGEPVEDEHAERAFLGERPDRLPRVESEKLQPCLEEEPFPGRTSREEEDPLVRGVLALQDKEGVRIPQVREAGKDPRTVQTGTHAFRVEPSEKAVFGVPAGELEEELPLGGAGAFPVAGRPEQREGEEPAEVKPLLSVPGHDAANVS